MKTSCGGCVAVSAQQSPDVAIEPICAVIDPKARSQLQIFLRIFPELRSRDLPSVNRVRPVGQPQGSKVRPLARKWSVLANPGGAVHLNSVIGYSKSDFRRNNLDFANPGRGGVIVALIHFPGRFQAQQPRHVDFASSIRNNVVVLTELGQRLAEGPSGD